MTAIRIFTAEDQHWFARVSGDFNPLHMNAAWAARTYPGEPVVHGMHAAMWALDAHLAAQPQTPLPGLRVTFAKPILVGDEVRLEAGTGKSIRLKVRGETMVILRLESGATPTAFAATAPQPIATSPKDRGAGPFVDIAGAILPPAASTELASRFSNLSRAVGSEVLTGLALISTVIGMDCPGLHSVLSNIDVTFRSSFAGPSLAFTVVKHHEVFSRVELQMQGCGLAGAVAAFAGRPEPAPMTDAELRALVGVDEFKNQHPVVIGASSGLGAVTARLLAAGSAEPVLTWRGSSTSLDATVAAVNALGGMSSDLAFDAENAAAGAARLLETGWRGGQVYYFASPRIFRRRIEPFQAGDFRDFLLIYANGFYETVRTLMESRGPEPLTVFYPSTTALDDPVADLFEYGLAKLAGEQLCQRLQDEYKSLKVVSIRLPRIATRQTMTSLDVAAARAEEIMAPIVRQVQRNSVA
jgi:NAD(P)-dependent dehydrogenase (short-subunit alcohol dehydrogenase family)